jgi:hypothetical protein
MNRSDNTPLNYSKAPLGLSVEDLHRIETYLRKNGRSQFVYDEELDIYRFPEDGRFAFGKCFADWNLLRERGYLDFWISE